MSGWDTVNANPWMVIKAEEIKLLSVKTAVYGNRLLTHVVELVSMELCKCGHRQVVTSREDIAHSWWRLDGRAFERWWLLQVLNTLLVEIKILNLIVNVHTSHVYIRYAALVREIRVVISSVIRTHGWNTTYVLWSNKSRIGGVSGSTSSANFSTINWIKIHNLIMVRILSSQLLLHRHGVELLELVYTAQRIWLINSWLIGLSLLLLVLELLLVMQHKYLWWWEMAAWNVSKIVILAIIAWVISVNGVASGDQLCVVERLRLAEAVELQLLLECLLLALGAEVARVLQHLASARLGVGDLHERDITVGHHILLRHDAVSLSPRIATREVPMPLKVLLLPNIQLLLL